MIIIARYVDIECDAVTEVLPRRAFKTRQDIQDFLNDIPTADVVPVVYGLWIRPHWKNSDYCCDCSKCGGEAMHREYQWNKKGIYPICPNCGAKMDGNKWEDVQHNG